MASRAASNMCRSRSSSLGCIKWPRIAQNFFAKMPTKLLRSPQIRLSPKDRGELFFHRHEPEVARHVFRIELHDKIDVAGRCLLTAKRRAEERKPLNVIPPA